MTTPADPVPSAPADSAVPTDPPTPAAAPDVPPVSPFDPDGSPHVPTTADVPVPATTNDTDAIAARLETIFAHLVKIEGAVAALAGVVPGTGTEVAAGAAVAETATTDAEAVVPVVASDLAEVLAFCRRVESAVGETAF